MKGWVWVEHEGQRCFVEIHQYNRRDDSYTVKFSNGSYATFSGSDVFEWNQVK